MLCRECEPNEGMVLLDRLLWRVCRASFMHDPEIKVGCPWGYSSCPYFEPAVWRVNAQRSWKASQEYGLWPLSWVALWTVDETIHMWSKAINPEAEIPYHLIQRNQRKKIGGGKGQGLRVTLATEVGVCIVPRVLVVLEDIKSCWLWIALQKIIVKPCFLTNI